MSMVDMSAETKVRWGMVIDLRKCIGCGACSLVCSQTNKIPYFLWRRVIECGVSGPPQRQRMAIPMSCMHCSQPPCLEVCPATATYRRPDGIVDIDTERCVGCGYCIVACPYLARSIMYNNSAEAESSATPKEKAEGSKMNRIGVSSKCNFCIRRIDAGLAKGLQPGIDNDASPACVISCCAGALSFGNLDDPESAVAQLLRENRVSCLQEELGTGPSVFYILEQT
ncbi:MAG: 4Fe-4S dicluster domain-containing protein [Nitrospirota bacterium]|nr:4Fe-4S dicluster domain-containing protein [Nitrospirota bacterium]